MICFQGFETKKEAEDFKKKNGGFITTRVATKSGRKPLSLTDYMWAVVAGGLDAEKYPYCVQWRELK